MKRIVLLPVVALLIATGCKPSDSSSSTSGAGSTSGSNNLDKVPYIGALARAEQTAGATADVASLKPAIEQFLLDKGRYPKNLDELVQEKYLPKIPDAPYGMKMDYDPLTGTVKVVRQ